MIRAFADRVVLSDGWARGAIAFAAGSVGALAMPPFGIWPALAVSLTLAVWLIDGSAAGSRFPAAAALRRAALSGWLWGLGYFVAGLWWIGQAFLVEADVFAWLLPFGVLGLPALLAFFPALGFALARAIWSAGAGRILALAFGLGTAEWLRGHVLTGFPWNALGLAFGQDLRLMQTASLVGMAGLTVIAVATLASPATLASAGSPASRYGSPAVAAAVLVAVAVFGWSRVPVEPSATVAGVRLRIMQPNLSQDAKFRPANGGTILDRYLSLSDRSTGPGATGLADVTHLIWPESAFPFLLHREPEALARIARALPSGAVLITGAARQGEELPGETRGRFHNSIQVVGQDGAVLATYDKVHLVPFGEYVPHALDATLRSIGIREFVKMPGGFTPGERRTDLSIPGAPPALATICYEAIFPDEVVSERARAGWLLNVTNDGWFGDTPGPRQHFAQARLRAVETGLPLVRAANTGISAVTDGYGRIVAALPVGVENVLDSPLPVALHLPFFVRFGALALVALYTICLGGAIAARYLQQA